MSGKNLSSFERISCKKNTSNFLACLIAKSAKILIYNLPHLPIEPINNLIVFCSTIDELVVALEKYNNFTIVVVFRTDKLAEVRPLLNRPSIDSVYIVRPDENLDVAAEPWWQKTTVVCNDKQLMRHLCTKSMLCYFNEGMEHRKNENMGLSNVCMMDSLRALEYSAKFI